MIGLLNFCHVVYHHHLIISCVVDFVGLALTRTVALAIFEGTAIAVNVLHEILVKLSL
jgi:hypothetical protein